MTLPVIAWSATEQSSHRAASGDWIASLAMTGENDKQ